MFAWLSPATGVTNSTPCCAKISVMRVFMGKDGPPPGEPVQFGERFAGSELFNQVFQEGMALVEETAHYLDGAGREQSRRLARSTALAYATESMRLTTRLMQIASWLLIHRAVADGEMPASEAYSEASRVPLKAPVPHRDRPFVEELPQTLRDLMSRTDRIYSRLYRIDLMLDPTKDRAPTATNAVGDQIDQLRAAFGESKDGE